MKLYKKLTQLGFKKSYSQKFLFMAFLGTHIPLIGLVAMLLVYETDDVSKWTVLIATFIYTLIAAGLTIFCLSRLLAPIRLATKTITEFGEKQKIIEVPTQYKDEAGLLLAQIDSTLRKISRLTKERKDFTNLITHDVRGPLTNAIGLSDLIINKAESDEVKKFADLLKQSAQSGLEVVGDLHLLMKSDNYTIQDSELEDVQVKSFIQSQVNIVKNAFLEKNIEFVLNISDEDKIRVKPQFFEHIIYNLISNAFKFSLNGGVVKVTGEFNGNKYLLKVKDSGVGFDSEDSNVLFEKFTPAKKTGTANEPTTGLGLYLTRTLVEKHGGSIEAKSKGENSGAEFILTI